MAEDREKFLQAEQKRIGYYKFNNGLILGSLKAKLMDAEEVDVFNVRLSELESTCCECDISLDLVINKNEISSKKKKLNTLTKS